MQKPAAVTDSSCMIALEAIGAIPQLSLLFSRVWLPKAVRKELFRRTRMKDRIKADLAAGSFLQPCDGYDQLHVDFLLAERVKNGTKDRGETEAAVQADTLNAMAIIDDPWGRKLAQDNGVECHGTLWVLARLHEIGLKTGPDIRHDLLTLRRSGLRLPIARVNELLGRIGEAPFSPRHSG